MHANTIFTPYLEPGHHNKVSDVRIMTNYKLTGPPSHVKRQNRHSCLKTNFQDERTLGCFLFSEEKMCSDYYCVEEDKTNCVQDIIHISFIKK